MAKRSLGEKNGKRGDVYGSYEPNHQTMRKKEKIEGKNQRGLGHGIGANELEGAIGAERSGRGKNTLFLRQGGKPSGKNA